ncbi:MAG TPA: hypothetical protein VH643_24150, partial [Gemmataceae bacterium]
MSDLPRRRLTLEEYQQQLALLRDIAYVAQDAARLYLALWDVPHCLTTVINAFLNLDRMLFPEGLAWEARVDDVAKTRRRVHHLTATHFWTKPCPPNEKMPKEAIVAPWMRLYDVYLALLHHYDRVLVDHGWERRIAERTWSESPTQPEQPSPSVIRLADTAELLAELSWHGAAEPQCIISLGNQNYRVGDADPVSVMEREDFILQAFLRRSPLRAFGKNEIVMGSRTSNKLTSNLNGGMPPESPRGDRADAVTAQSHA